MERIRTSLSRLPSWSLSVITFLAILWLTLASKPLGENPPELFPGADKLAHGLMFGGYAVVQLLDWQRRHSWQPVSFNLAMLCAVMSSVLGVLIEFAQANMGLGRSYEQADIVADMAGAFCFAISFVLLQGNWCRNKD